MRINREKLLRTPGPTPVPEQIQRAMAQPMIGHRGEEFSKLLIDTTKRLRPIFGTNQDVLILSGSGTSALEAAVINITQPGDHVAVIVTGAFGERFADICQTFELNVSRLETEWGSACNPDQLRQFLKSTPQLKAVFLTHCETSTGVLNPIADLAKVVRESSDALVVVDGVSSVAGVRTDMDQWGLDIVVSGSQKAFMCPPGLALVAVSPRAWKKVKTLPKKPFYLNLLACQQSLEKGMTPFTPAISLIYGLNEACHLIEEEGLEHVQHRHILLKNMTRASIRSVGLPLLASMEDGSPTVTAITVTEGLDTEQFRKTARESFQLILAGGQKKLKGQLVRIGHMGSCTPTELIQSLFLFELTLKRIGWPVHPGTMVKAAEEVLFDDLSSAH